MLGLVIVGRYARDIEHTNPGRTLNEILLSSTAATPVATPTTPTHPRVVPVNLIRPLSAAVGSTSQAASFTEVN